MILSKYVNKKRLEVFQEQCKTFSGLLNFWKTFRMHENYRHDFKTIVFHLWQKCIDHLW